MTNKPVVGVDVAKRWLDVCVAGAVERIDNTAAVLSWLDRVRPGLVACEPTGGYERPLLGVLGEHAIPFVSSPSQPACRLSQEPGAARQDQPDRCPADLSLCLPAAVTARSAHGRPRQPGAGRRGGARRQLIDGLHAERCRLAMARLEVLRDSRQASSPRSAAASMPSTANAPRSSPATRKPPSWPRCCRRSVASDPPSPPHRPLTSRNSASCPPNRSPPSSAWRPYQPQWQSPIREPIGQGRPGVRRALFNAPMPRSATPRPSASSTSAWSTKTKDRAKSPWSPSCAKSSSAPTPSPAISNPGNSLNLSPKPLDANPGRWPGQAHGHDEPLGTKSRAMIRTSCKSASTGPPYA